MQKYQPISCGFHDYLEHFATLRKPVRILYRQADDQEIELNNAVIFNFSGGRDGEFIHVIVESVAKTIRMDYLIAVEQIFLKDFGDTNCQLKIVS